MYSKLVLITRTRGNVWMVLSEAEAYPRSKEIGGVSDHSLSGVWNSGLAFLIHSIKEANTVRLRSTDVVSTGCMRGYVPPVAVWISVTPDTLFYRDWQIVSNAFKELFAVHDINDIAVVI